MARRILFIIVLIAALPSRAPAQAPRSPATAPAQASPTLSLVFGRPTDRSIAVNLLSTQACEARLAYGVMPGDYTARTAVAQLQAGTPAEIQLQGLDPDRWYVFGIEFRQRADDAFTPGATGRFHTQRVPGRAFTFEIQGDSHPERPQMFDSTLYAQTLRSAAADRPDFYLTLGDDFSADKLRTVTAGALRQVYLDQRRFLALVGAPIFLVNGNHEQAALANLDGTADNVAVWAQNARNSLFPQPGPDGFYTGDARMVDHIGLLRDYYAWTWGDALFVVIDPYWHSAKPVDNVFGSRDKGKRDLWGVTLGDEQYRWLKKTLEESRSKYKFVFAHHVLGTGRGGIERAGLFEWGGKSLNGADDFARNRPGWQLPIHPLMARNGVTIFFQGHDHIFVRQELDGVVYQSLPLPADPNYAFYNRDAYRTGDAFPGSGRVRVTVSAQKVRVEYVRSYLPRDSTPQHPDGEIAFAYERSAPASLPQTRPAPADPQPRRGAAPNAGFRTEVPAHPVDIILGRPTASGITLSALFYADARCNIAYGADPGMLSGRTDLRACKAGEPAEFVIDSLEPDTACRYELRAAGADQVLASGRFRTQRPPGSAFTFTVTADSHLDDRTDTALYRRTLLNVLADSPDFHIDLGDTFMTGKHSTREAAARQYLAQRYYFGLMASSAPLFLVLGNHDGEEARQYDGTPDCLAVWSNAMRKRYFPNPVPDAFYSGNQASHKLAGLLQDYYAWTWSDALFIVLDPFWHSARPRGRDDNWAMSLGEAQYKWLSATLAASKSRHRFIFIHHLVGGMDNQSRGGIEAAPFYEWGGRNADGTDGFKSHRPGWNMPIHDLLVRHRVSAVFHGHDHCCVRQELDGIVYQLVPQPANPGAVGSRIAAEYGYTKGQMLDGCGYMRVTVDSAAFNITFVPTVVPPDPNAGPTPGRGAGR